MPKFQMFPLRANNVLQLFNMKDEIDLDPPYQRLSVWDRPKQQRFIDSVINGFDIPKLYFHEVPLSVQIKKYKYRVIDGKQRLLALWEFMQDGFPLSNDLIFYDNENLKASGRKYTNLLLEYPRLRARFDSFEVPVTVVRTDDDDFIENLFSRLNIQMELSGAELRNALGGPIPYLIRKIAVSPFFKESVNITNARLQHFELAAKFLYLTHVDSIGATYRAVLDNFVKDFKRLRQTANAEALDAQLAKLESKTLEILKEMHGFFKHQDSLLKSQGKATLYFHIFRVCRLKNQRIPFTREMLAQFEDELIAARKKSYRRATGSTEPLTDMEQTLALFDSLKQALNDAGAMKRRYNYIAKYFVERFSVTLPDPDSSIPS